MRTPLLSLAIVLLMGWQLPAAADLNVRNVAPGVYTGSAPRSPADYRRLQQLGIRTVIDSRRFLAGARRREQNALSCRGIRYVHIPIDFHPTDDHSPHRVLAQLADPTNQPVYLHCQLGRDRTGLVVALYRVYYLGWDPAAAYAAMERQQFNPLLKDLDRYFWQHVAGAGCASDACTCRSHAY